MGEEFDAIVTFFVERRDVFGQFELAGAFIEVNVRDLHCFIAVFEFAIASSALDFLDEEAIDELDRRAGGDIGIDHAGGDLDGAAG